MIEQTTDLAFYFEEKLLDIVNEMNDAGWSCGIVAAAMKDNHGFHLRKGSMAHKNHNIDTLVCNIYEQISFLSSDLRKNNH